MTPSRLDALARRLWLFLYACILVLTGYLVVGLALVVAKHWLR